MFIGPPLGAVQSREIWPCLVSAMLRFQLVSGAYQFAAGIALHGLRLAVASVMVRTSTLVAGSSSVVLHAIVSASESTSTAWSRGTCARCWAASCKVADLTAVVTAASLRATNAQSWAVSLDVA